MNSERKTEAIAAARATEFPEADRFVYLNAAAFGMVPRRSVRAAETFHRLRNEEADRLTDQMLGVTLAETRQALATLIGAAPEEIALGTNTSFGLNLAAGSCLLGDQRDAGRRIILSDREFPANVYPWLALERHGMEVEIVPTDPHGRPREDVLLDRLQSANDVAIFTISAVQFATGYRANLARFGQVYRERGILFVVDGIQAVGVVPLDVREAGIDILACGGHKWLCGPFGTGFAYVRRELISQLEPLFPGWLAFTSGGDTTHTIEYGSVYLPDARRYEVGSMPFQDFLGLTRSAELLLELGIPEIWDHVRAIQQPLIDWARGRGEVEIISDLADDRRSGILSLRPPDVERVHATLASAGIICTVRQGAIRFAPHFYNTMDEMERVVGILDEALA